MEVLFSEGSLTQCERPTARCLHPQEGYENASVLQADRSVKGSRARHGKVKHSRRSSDE